MVHNVNDGQIQPRLRPLIDLNHHPYPQPPNGRTTFPEKRRPQCAQGLALIGCADAHASCALFCFPYATADRSPFFFLPSTDNRIGDWSSLHLVSAGKTMLETSDWHGVHLDVLVVGDPELGHWASYIFVFFHCLHEDPPRRTIYGIYIY